VSMQNSRTRFDDDACHERGMLAQSFERAV
jgi:hypothetical protein